jgi:hypothetical protein
MQTSATHWIVMQCEAVLTVWVHAVAVQPGCGEPGYASDLEEGLDWVLEKHLAQPEPRKPGIVSMSLIISKQSSSAELISEKVEELIENGVIVVAAAGNFHEGLLSSCSHA